MLSVKASKYRRVATYWPSRVFELYVATVVILNVVLGCINIGSDIETLQIVDAERYLTYFQTLSALTFSVRPSHSLPACTA